MPFMKDGKRDYKREVALYTSKPVVKKKRAEQNAARREYEKANGDLPRSVEVDHKKPLSKGGTNSKSNLRAVPAKENRSFSRNANGSLKSQTSKRERKK